MKLIKSFVLFILVLVSTNSIGQHRVIKNLQDFDEHKFHFGFALGYNKADFYMREKLGNFANDSLLSIDVVGKSGFNLGIVSSLNITPMMRLRFLPTLSFQERTVDYTYFEEPDTTIFWSKTASATMLDFPLLLKMRTQRIGNFAVYMIAGGRFGLDMQSQKDVKNSDNDLKNQVLKFTKPDYGIEVGGGFDFFLEYFKFGIEMKLGTGFKNILIQENLKFSSPIEQIRSKMWTVSLTFEG
jgi:hypothetical protein